MRRSTTSRHSLNMLEERDVYVQEQRTTTTPQERRVEPIMADPLTEAEQNAGMTRDFKTWHIVQTKKMYPTSKSVLHADYLLPEIDEEKARPPTSSHKLKGINFGDYLRGLEEAEMTKKDQQKITKKHHVHPTATRKVSSVSHSTAASTPTKNSIPIGAKPQRKRDIIRKIANEWFELCYDINGPIHLWMEWL
ncbi:unnamed protein product [Amoebophrya sp. A120]|nr:unnamed protein product [Amoebophrya sp. A120]|eukprot:GSA120T00014682001.1